MQKRNEYDYDYEYDHEDKQLIDTLMIKFERQLHERNETLQQTLHRVDKYLNDKSNRIRSWSIGLDALRYKYTVDARLREIDYFSGTYDDYLHPERCEHSNPDYSTGE